ncbi:hypothetical protein SLS60_008740 [Paraconiothyrium brasiliense]|uniref:P-loop containing nucleoside triphosphate hydrolase protein n=1 Tax=Paraconiothyrium brasiliense TaxID=300254 RepID=A0ABR3QYC5_9PLEO
MTGGASKSTPEEGPDRRSPSTAGDLKVNERLQEQTSPHDLDLRELRSEDAMAKKKSQRPDARIPKPWPAFSPNLTDASFNLTTQEGPLGRDAWVQWHYCTSAWHANGEFKGWKWLKEHLVPRSNCSEVVIRTTVSRLRQADENYSYPMLDEQGVPLFTEIKKIITNQRMPPLIANKPTTRLGISGTSPTTPFGPRVAGPTTQISTSTPHTSPPPPAQLGDAFNPPSGEHIAAEQGPRDDLLARQLGQMRLDTCAGQDTGTSHQRESSRREQDRSSPDSIYTPLSADNSDVSEEDSLEAGATVDLDAMDILLTDHSSANVGNADHHAEIRNAPLADESIFRAKTTARLIPQFGFMGTQDQNIDNANSKLFLNTNVPFSAFVCGVQGSGKSHTTSCILENCLIPSKNLGVLQEPLSALVFSYSLFTGDGAGFSISEAAFLGAPSPRFGNAHVKKIHVLVCDTNLRRIRKLYERLPNVTVSAFKLNPRNLDIDLMLTLMNVSESDRMPLYMGAILQIIREMATASDRFDYRVFKAHVRQQRFTPDQENMLKIRLDLLESFLDLQGTNRDDMLFKPGEITIMDMSCPFVDVNTACIMFRCGLQRYLQSRASGKLVVLDEAHKYMLDVPGAKGLNQALVDTIRMQRHTGTRVVVSTQEPTLLTDLIALCSVAVIHRFSSPEWFNAIKRHIRIPEADREALMERIEGLSTGTAIVYSANSVLGYDEGRLKKGTGIMTKVKMRKRITADGGQSVLAV